MAVLHEVGRAWAEAHGADTLGEPEVQGILAFGDSAMTLRLAIMVRPGAAWRERELRQRVKAAFDAAGIEMPYPTRVIYTRGAAAGREEVSR
jgi:small conductance mechanosensitive channel